MLQFPRFLCTKHLKCCHFQDFCAPFIGKLPQQELHPGNCPRNDYTRALISKKISVSKSVIFRKLTPKILKGACSPALSLANLKMAQFCSCNGQLTPPKLWTVTVIGWGDSWVLCKFHLLLQLQHLSFWAQPKLQPDLPRTSTSRPLCPDARGSRGFSVPPGPQKNKTCGADVHDFMARKLLKNYIEKSR